MSRSLTLQGLVRLYEVIVNPLTFGELGLHGLPSLLSLHPLSDRAVQSLDAVVVAIYGIVFTRNLMDFARKKYVVEAGIFAV